MRTIADVAVGRDNNFNLLRMIAASAVLVSHSWPLAVGEGTVEPLYDLFGYKLGTVSVMIFFAVSGFFIAKSFDGRRSFADFLSARAIRIFPGLLVVLLLTVLLLGPVFTSLSLGDYATHRLSWTYVPRNLLLYRLQYQLPGVFESNPGGVAINGSLWTLFHEVKCYAMVVAVGLAGLLRPRAFVLFLIAFCAWQVWARLDAASGHGAQFALLSYPFAIGMAIYVWRDRLPVSGWIALGLAVAAAALRWTPAWHAAFPLALAYGCFWFGFVRLPWLLRYNRFGDYSYGMYIYAFPVQQAIVAAAGPVGPFGLTLIALPITLLLAILSWRLVEHPALKRRHSLVPPTRRRAQVATQN